MNRKKHLSLALMLALSSAWACGQYTDGQSVEVREGDTWSPATVLKREGRRFNIRYQGSTEEEWVTADRLRAPGTAGAAVSPQPQPTGTTASTPPAAPDEAKWKPGQDVESKRGMAWRPAKYQKTENGWVLVQYSQGNYFEWVEPWRIRAVGSKEDFSGAAPMNREAKAGDPPPAAAPGDGPGTFSAPSGWREPVVGDRVLYLDGWKVQTAKVLAKRGDGYQVQLEEARQSKMVEPMDIRVMGLKLDAKVGQRVQLREPQGWQSGSVMERDGDRVRIMKDGWAHEMHHKWCSIEEIRPASADDVPPIDTATDEQLRNVPGYKEANAGAARKLNLLIAGGASYSPDAANLAEVPAMQVAPLQGPTDAIKPNAVATTRTGQFAVVSSGAVMKDLAVLDRIDLKSGEHLNTVQLQVPRDMAALDVSDDGTKVLMGPARMGGDRVEIWSIDGATPKRVLLMFPYAGGNHFEKQVRFAAMPAEDRLLTISGKGEMHLWDTNTGRAVYTCAAGSDSRPGISPGGKYMAFSTGKDALIIEIATGKGIMDLPAELARATAFSFSPDGTELVACDRSNVYAVDLKTGKLTYDFAIPGKTSLQSIASPGAGYAMVNGNVLVDLKTRAPAWKYRLEQTAGATVASTGQLVFAQSDGMGTILAAAKVPHESALKQIDSLKDREMLLKPGTAVSLVVNLSAAESERNAITTYLRNQLTSNGFTIADNSPVRVVASLERGQVIQEQYQSGPRFGPFAGRPENVTIAPWVSKISLEHNGKPVWEVSATTGGPSPILMKRGDQTAQQAAEEQNRPNTGLFMSTRIPAFMVMPANPLHRSESQFTGRGFRDMPAVPDPDQPATPPKPTLTSDGTVA